MTKDQKIAKKNAEIRELKRAPIEQLRSTAQGLASLAGAFAVPGVLGAPARGAIPFVLGGAGLAVNLLTDQNSGFRFLSAPLVGGAHGMAGVKGYEMLGGSPASAMARIFGTNA